MRIRSVLPKFYESEDVGNMDWFTRLVFIGLWSYADDNGVGRDVPALIASDLFPFDMSRDSRETLARVASALQTLSDGGQIIRYRNDSGPLFFVCKWDEYQRVDRPAKARYMRPTREDAVIRETVATPSRDPRDTLAPGEGEKGRSKRTPSIDIDGEFETFWKHYPRKVDKGHARTAYRAARKKAHAEALLDGVRSFAEMNVDTDPKYVAHCSTWLNGERWTDLQPTITEPVIRTIHGEDDLP